MEFHVYLFTYLTHKALSLLPSKCEDTVVNVTYFILMKILTYLKETQIK